MNALIEFLLQCLVVIGIATLVLIVAGFAIGFLKFTYEVWFKKW